MTDLVAAARELTTAPTIRIAQARALALVPLMADEIERLRAALGWTYTTQGRD